MSIVEQDIEIAGLLWVATIRRDIDYHSAPSGRTSTTVCGRSTRTGAFITPGRVVEVGARPRPRCYLAGSPAA